MRAIVSLSGGMDSATCLALCRQKWLGDQILAVLFAYGSKHNVWENKAALDLARHYQVKSRFIDLSHVMDEFKSDLLLTGGDLPEGHYEAESMKRTVVPARNLIFASILAGTAASEGAEEIWLGVHAGDRAIYPDCRPEFVNSLRQTIEYAVGRNIDIQTPFLNVYKRHILNTGYQLHPQVPYHLTRTCYSSDQIACGRCGSCQERLAAYEAIDRKDPIAYQSRDIMPKGE